VIAVSEAKDAGGILAPLFDLPASFIFTSFETPGRVSARPTRLVNIAESAGFSARAILDPIEALAIARRRTDASSVVVVTGSTFVVGELRDWWLANVAERTRK
jgi:folylpolyglutamate synthase/dihydropteroate synthase